jgi:hypothetical protein
MNNPQETIRRLQADWDAYVRTQPLAYGLDGALRIQSRIVGGVVVNLDAGTGYLTPENAAKAREVEEQIQRRQVRGRLALALADARYYRDEAVRGVAAWNEKIAGLEAQLETCG